jgi:hypothetical protein
MQINLNYGALSDPLEERANKQGFTLGEKVKLCKKLEYGLVLNTVYGTWARSQYDKAIQKLHNKVIKEVKLIESEE